MTQNAANFTKTNKTTNNECTTQIIKPQQARVSTVYFRVYIMLSDMPLQYQQPIKRTQ